MDQSIQRSYVSGRKQTREGIAVKSVSLDQAEKLGIGFNPGVLRSLMDHTAGHAMDAGLLQPGITTPSVPSVVQFLQNWLPGLVKVTTAARRIDLIAGKTVAGSWEDEEIVQGILEPLGNAVPYGDLTNVPVADWNVVWNKRTVVRFELGIQVNALEQARSARVRIDTAAEKRYSAQRQLEIARNKVGFFGFNNGNNLTYGFLNDPGLPAYQTVANTNWATSTFLEIQSDLLTAIQELRTQSEDVIDPDMVPLTLTLATSVRDYLSTPTDFGYSVMKWLNDTYPKIRVESAPELNGANGGLNVFYLHADEVPDDSSDGDRTLIQVVPATFQVLGVAQAAKGYTEDYSNATAGIMLKRPYAITRWSGI